MRAILVIDDEYSILTALRFALEEQYKVFCAAKADEAWKILGDQDIRLVLLDQRLGEVNGLEFLQRIKQEFPAVIVIVMTAYGNIESSIQAIKNGAYYYITKPLDLPGLQVLMSKALEYQTMSERLEQLTQQLGAREAASRLIGKSRPIQRVLELIDSVKDIDVNVLVLGESGTGKELVVNSIHHGGRRRAAPLETVNCAAIPYALLESELFGYEKGAFTGATQRYRGKLEAANGGTLFLDEIGDMELGLQAKLLRVLEERRVKPLGSERSLPLDIKVVAATNKNLVEAIAQKCFREDLYFRLNVISIQLPPLREHREDIMMLAVHFIQKYSEQFRKVVTGISPEAAALLESYHYPGNVRELQNIIERAIVLTKTSTLEVCDLPSELLGRQLAERSREWVPAYVGESLATVERHLILRTLEHFHNNKAQAAKVLGMSERHIRNKIKEYSGDPDAVEAPSPG